VIISTRIKLTAKSFFITKSPFLLFVKLAISPSNV
jgi:hypothetical protein